MAMAICNSAFPYINLTQQELQRLQPSREVSEERCGDKVGEASGANGVSAAGKVVDFDADEAGEARETGERGENAEAGEICERRGVRHASKAVTARTNSTSPSTTAWPQSPQSTTASTYSASPLTPSTSPPPLRSTPPRPCSASTPPSTQHFVFDSWQRGDTGHLSEPNDELYGLGAYGETTSSSRLSTRSTPLPRRITPSLNRRKTRFVLEGKHRPVDATELERIEYQCASPEEGCLVKAASVMGFTLTRRAQSHVTVDVNGEVEKIEVIGSIEAEGTSSSSSVKSSVSVGCGKSVTDRLVMVVRNMYTGEGILYMKSDCQTLHNLLSESEMESLTRNVSRLRSRGLRTIIFSQRKMTVDETSLFNSMFSDARDSVYDRDLRMMKVVEAFTSKVEVLGIAGVRDALHPDVTSTIHKLIQASIRVWMVTGDSPTHAIDAAHSSNMIHTNTTIFYCILNPQGNSPRCEAQVMHSVFRREREKSERSHICLVTTGSTLTCMLSSVEMSCVLLSMALSSDCVLFCDVGAEQKGEVVRVLRERLRPTPTILGIGDGMNDVSLLRACDVGVGVLSNNRVCPLVESASDYFIPHFNNLTRLLLVHGRLSLLRNSNFILFNIYILNIVQLPVVSYQFINQFSGLNIFQSHLLAMVLIALTIMPLMMLYAVSEVDVPIRALEHLPVLYGLGRRYYSTTHIFLCISEAMTERTTTPSR
eukprot:GHVN01102385.1.p1 GENE.GHVN01102385.1~~GHVN01102385.1.p1  ORF type:complete len:709 (+),score=150.64 GHVN01102385.1:739-2865(+)